MKIKNKKTGKIVEWENPLHYKLGREYLTIKEFVEDWEDYEEPKDFWYIDVECGVMCDSTDPDLQDKKYPMEFMKSIGNYFESKEEAEQAVEKLKAWTRLQEKGFRFESYKPYGTGITFTIAHMDELAEDNQKDLDLLFGGEDE